MSTYVSSVLAGGQAFYFPFADHRWEVVGGYQAPIQGWLVPTGTAASIMRALGKSVGAAREVTLTFGDPDSLVTVKRVIVLGLAPADNTQRRILLLSDVRWYFTRAWCNWDVNIRRRVGDKRLVGDSLIEASSADTIAYALWSTDYGVPHSWYTFKEQVLAYLTSARHGRPLLEFVTDVAFTIDKWDNTVQETATDSPGPAALAQMIEATPGMGLYVDLDGRLHLYDRVPGAEKPLIEQLPPPLMGHGDLVWIDNSSIRPRADSDKAWRIYVDYEIEVRFDYNPPSPAANPDDPTDPANNSSLWNALATTELSNVLQVTDQSLSIPEGPWGRARIVGQGTWITFDEAFAAWDPPAYGSITLPRLTDDIVASHWFGDGLMNYTVGSIPESYDPVWGARIQELMRCYRTVFRCDHNFWDRVRMAFPTRAAVWDPTTGTRAPSPVYCNFNLTPYNRYASAEIFQLGINHMGSYPDSYLLADGHPSGFRVVILDQELGVFSIDRDLSRFRGHTQIAISPVQKPASFNAILAADRQVQTQQLVLKSGDKPWRLSMVLSCIPGAPNSQRRMYEIGVSTKDAALAAGLSGYASPGFGPDIEERSQLASARVAWQDGSADDESSVAGEIVFKLFGDGTFEIGAGDPPSGAIVPINLKQELIPLAQSIAAADLISKLDHYEGSMAVPANSDLAPLGSITSVTHLVTEGRAQSIVHCSPMPPPFRAIDFLQGSARSYLLKEIASKR